MIGECRSLQLKGIIFCNPCLRSLDTLEVNFHFIKAILGSGNDSSQVSSP